MNTKDFIGLEVCKAKAILEQSKANFKFVYYVDKKQDDFDKEIVTAVRQEGDLLVLVVCRFRYDVV